MCVNLTQEHFNIHTANKEHIERNQGLNKYCSSTINSFQNISDCPHINFFYRVQKLLSINISLIKISLKFTQDWNRYHKSLRWNLCFLQAIVAAKVFHKQFSCKGRIAQFFVNSTESLQCSFMQHFFNNSFSKQQQQQKRTAFQKLFLKKTSNFPFALFTVSVCLLILKTTLLHGLNTPSFSTVLTLWIYIWS